MIKATVWGVINKVGKDGQRIFVQSDDKVTGVVVDYPLFTRKKDAEEFRQKNKELQVVPVKIKL